MVPIQTGQKLYDLMKSLFLRNRILQRIKEPPGQKIIIHSYGHLYSFLSGTPQPQGLKHFMALSAYWTLGPKENGLNLLDHKLSVPKISYISTGREWVESAFPNTVLSPNNCISDPFYFRTSPSSTSFNSVYFFSLYPANVGVPLPSS